MNDKVKEISNSDTTKVTPKSDLPTMTCFCYFMTFSFRVMFNERLDLAPFLNKILLFLSSPKCIEIFLSVNLSQSLLKSQFNFFFNELDILVAIKYTRIICGKVEGRKSSCRLHIAKIV